MEMQLVTKKWGCRSVKEKVIFTYRAARTHKLHGYSCIVERQITLTFVNKVRSLILLSVESKVILLLI